MSPTISRAALSGTAASSARISMTSTMEASAAAVMTVIAIPLGDRHRLGLFKTEGLRLSAADGRIEWTGATSST